MDTLRFGLITDFPAKYWLDPQGRFHDCTNDGHDDWAEANRGMDMDHLEQAGWVHLIALRDENGSKEIYVSSRQLSRSARTQLERVAVNHEASLLWSRGEREPKPLYTPPTGARGMIEARAYPGYWIRPDGRAFKLGDQEEHKTAKAVLDVMDPASAGWARVLVMPQHYEHAAEILVDAKQLTVSQRKSILRLAAHYGATPYRVGLTHARQLIETMLPNNWRVTVQAPGPGYKGFVQIDTVGAERGSATPEALAAQGYVVPPWLGALPTGRYSVGELRSQRPF